MAEKEITYIPQSKIGKETITVYGAGIFNESKLVLNKQRAIFLLNELFIFLEEDLKKEKENLDNKN